MEVRDFDKPFVPSFLNDVQPVLTKGGCNSGACHGSEAGKNGFKLSLRGYDPEFDHAVLTRQANGRRVARWAPEHSLMLRKPTLTLPHQGGKRFAVDSPEFRVLSEWIANGAPAPLASDTVIESLSVFPEQAWLTPGAEQQVLVQANYSDGTSRDVTRWVKFSSTDSGVATVNDLGQVKMQGAGQAAITVWYSSKVVFARVGVAFDHKIDAKVYAEAPKNNYTRISNLELRLQHGTRSLLLNATTLPRKAGHDGIRRGPVACSCRPVSPSRCCSANWSHTPPTLLPQRPDFLPEREGPNHPAQVAPRSDAACRRTACGSDGLRPAAASNTARA